MFLRKDVDLKSGRDLSSALSESLSYAPFELVSIVRFAEFFRYSDAKPCYRAPSFAELEGYVLSKNARGI